MRNLTQYILLAAVITQCLSCGSIKVTAKGNGIRTGNTGEETVSLAVTRGNADAINTNRLYFFNVQPLEQNHRLPACQLKVEITGNPNNLGESYVYLQLLPEDLRFNGGTSTDKNYIANSIGKIANLRSPQANNAEDAVTNDKSHFGLGILAIVQNDDRTVPWAFPSGSSHLGVDMQTLSKKIFRQIQRKVDTVLKSVPGNLVASQHELLYVPHVVHHVKVAAPTGNVDVYVPINFIFKENLENYRLFIDPMDNSASTPAPGALDHIYVKGEFASAVLEGLLLNIVRDAIKTAPLAEIAPGVNNADLLMLALNLATGSEPPATGTPRRVNAKYDMILLPESEERLINNTVLWRKTGQGDTDTENINKVKLVFLE
jgi:hypothetical protein